MAAQHGLNVSTVNPIFGPNRTQILHLVAIHHKMLVSPNICSTAWTYSPHLNPLSIPESFDTALPSLLPVHPAAFQPARPHFRPAFHNDSASTDLPGPSGTLVCCSGQRLNIVRPAHAFPLWSRCYSVPSVFSPSSSIVPVIRQDGFTSALSSTLVSDWG